MINPVQPLSPVQSPLSVQLLNDVAPYAPANPTSISLLSTMPTRQVNRYSAVPQLPTNIINSLVNQQAVSAANMSKIQKSSIGIVTNAGATLRQLSAPGQLIKPGAGEFIKQLTNKTSLPMPVIASGALMTGLAGVTNPLSLVNNVQAQLSSMTQSIVKSTTELASAGILSAVKLPLDSAGIIQAGSVFGTQSLLPALQNPLNAVGELSKQGTQILDSISSGNFAASLTDSFSSGLNGVVSSISGLANNALGSVTSSISGITSGITSSIGSITSGLSSGLGGLTSGLTSGLGSLTSGLSSGLGGLASGLIGSGIKALSGLFSKKINKSAIAAAEQAFKIAESSFGSLNANQPNYLGGATAITAPSSGIETNLRSYTSAAETVSSIEDSLDSIKKQYSLNPTSDLLQELRGLEKSLSVEKQKLATVTNSVVTGQISNLNIPGSVGSISAQNVSSLTNSFFSGQLTQATPANSGINSLPGGLSAFANVYDSATNQVLNVVKNAGGAGNSLLNQALNPQKIAGNLVGNIKDNINQFNSTITNSIQAINSPLQAVIPGAANLLSKVTSLGAIGGSGIIGKISSSISSFGRAPGQIKSALLGSKTSQTSNAVISATLNATLDPKIPPPVFEPVVPSYTADSFQQAQIQAQSAINRLISERDVLELQIGKLYDDFFNNNPSSDPSTLPRFAQGPLVQIEKLREQVATLDKNIQAAQQNYERLISF